MGFRHPQAPKERPLTDFEQIVVAFVVKSPSSAYDLKRLFSTSPASVYQPSAGTLVPALRRLEQSGYLRADVVVGRHRRRVYHATDKGRAAHQAWVRQPVTPQSVGRDLGLHLMRFVMMEGELSDTEVAGFLADLAAALEAFIAEIEAYLAAGALSGLHPRLALGHGVAVHRASLEWARATMDSVVGQHRARPRPRAAGTTSRHQ